MFRGLVCAALAGLLGASACGDSGDGKPSADAAPFVDGASSVSCEERSPLEIGQCVDDATGEPCLDFDSPDRLFVSITDEPVVPTIIGLQGSAMFVLAVRALEIAEGEDDMAPLVDLQVKFDGDYLGGYTSKPIVHVDDKGRVVAPQLYVVIFAPEDLEGEMVAVEAEVTDRNGDGWCGGGEFEVGALIESEPIE